jgi:hypothetical protein
MGNWKNLNFFLSIVLFCLFTQLSYAQPIIRSSVDKREILIGEQFTLTIQAEFSPIDYTLQWPVLSDSMAHFEVLSQHIDSLYNNQQLSGLVQKITFTSFDSGKWVLPSLLVKVAPVMQGSSVDFFSDSMSITVSFSTSDTTQQLRDIKPIREVETIHPIWNWVGAGVVLAAVIALLTWWWKRKRKIKADPFQSNLSAYEEAMQELKKLAGYNLAVREEVKIFHSQLAAIFKQYLSRIYQQPYLSKTTREILLLLKEQQVEDQLLNKVLISLHYGDAVKFAKYFPPVSESEHCMKLVEELVKEIKKLKETSKPLNI